MCLINTREPTKEETETIKIAYKVLRRTSDKKLIFPYARNNGSYYVKPKAWNKNSATKNNLTCRLHLKNTEDVKLGFHVFLNANDAIEWDNSEVVAKVEVKEITQIGQQDDYDFPCARVQQFRIKEIIQESRYNDTPYFFECPKEDDYTEYIK